MEYPDKLGCYRVGDLKFYSKLEAIESMEKTGVHLHWDFNEAVFDCYDWTTEPTENILELYRQRAQQLRDKYDYIVLMYSSGSDSETVLNAFVDNDIKLDEVASLVNYDATGDKNNFLNYEIFEKAVPNIEKLQDHCTGLRHRLIDLTQMEIDYFNSKKSKFEWIYQVNTFFNPNCVSRENLGLKIKDWSDIIHSGKKFCILWGTDKPRIFHENNRFSLRFIDIVDNCSTIEGMSGQLPYVNELFYWTPDFPRLIIKQGHLIKNYLNAHAVRSLFVSNRRSDLAYKTINNKKYWLNSNGMISIIYPKFRNSDIAAPKPPSTIMSLRDIWFMDLEQDNSSLHIWKMGIEKLWQVLPDYWKNNPELVASGLKLCWSKDYYLE